MVNASSAFGLVGSGALVICPDHESGGGGFGSPWLAGWVAPCCPACWGAWLADWACPAAENRRYPDRRSLARRRRLRSDHHTGQPPPPPSRETMYPCGVDRRIRWPGRMRWPRTTRSLTPSSPKTTFSPKTTLPAVLRSHQFLAPAEVLSQPSNTHGLPVRAAQTLGGLFRWPCGEITAGGQSACSQSTHCYRRGDLSGVRGGWCACSARQNQGGQQHGSVP